MKSSLITLAVFAVILCSFITHAAASPYEAHCDEPLPVFTLGEKSNPTKTQEKELCACMWKNLGKWERETSQKYREGKESEVSWLHKQGFPSRFMSALEKCGGMKL